MVVTFVFSVVQRLGSGRTPRSGGLPWNRLLGRSANRPTVCCLHDGHTFRPHLWSKSKARLFPGVPQLIRWEGKAWGNVYRHRESPSALSLDHQLLPVRSGLSRYDPPLGWLETGLSRDAGTPACPLDPHIEYRVCEHRDREAQTEERHQPVFSWLDRRQLLRMLLETPIGSIPKPVTHSLVLDRHTA
jgi:hypothetical protein